MHKCVVCSSATVACRPWEESTHQFTVWEKYIVYLNSNDFVVCAYIMHITIIMYNLMIVAFDLCFHCLYVMRMACQKRAALTQELVPEIQEFWCSVRQG